MATQWFYQDGSEQRGPIAFRDLVELVRSGTLTQSALVRPSWRLGWQRADSVVGLFHMAGLSAKALARLDNDVRPPPATEPMAAEAVADCGAPAPDEPPERPLWMTRLFSLTAFGRQRPSEIAICGSPPANDRLAMAAPKTAAPAVAATAAPEQLIPGLAESTAPNAPPSDTSWSSVVDAALKRAEKRAARSNPPVGGIARRVSRLFASVREPGRSKGVRQAFRVVCAIVCASLVAFAIESRSRYEQLRFPARVTMRVDVAAMHTFPLVGKCGAGEYIVLLFDVMVLTGAAAWFTAKWLDSCAD